MLLCTGSALTSRLALKHKSVYGVAMGYTPVPEPGGGWQGCGIVDLMHLALGKCPERRQETGFQGKRERQIGPQPA